MATHPTTSPVGKKGLLLITLTTSLTLLHATYESSVLGHLLAYRVGTATLIFGSRSGLNLTQLFYLGSCVIYGALLAFVLAIPLVRVLSPKRTFLLGLGLALIGAVVEVAAASYAQGLAARCILGLGYGFQLVGAPVWVVEAVGREVRGMVVLTLFLAGAFGGELGRWLMYGFERVYGPAGWRAPLGLGLVFLVPAGVLGFLAPDSRGEQRGAGGEHVASGPYGEIAGGKGNTGGKKGEEKGARRWWRFALGIWVQCMVPLTGEIVTDLSLFLGPTRVSDGFSNPRLLRTMLGLVTLVMSAVAVWLVERLGRRKLLLFAAIGQAIFWIPLTVLTSLDEGSVYGYYSDSATVTDAAIAFAFLWNVCSAIGFGGVPILFATEINTARLRSQGLACSWVLRYGFIIMMSHIRSLGLAYLRWRFLIVWAVSNAFFAVVIWIFYPEPAGRSLEGIDDLFARSTGRFVGNKKEATTVCRSGRDIDNGDSVGLVDRSSDQQGGL